MKVALIVIAMLSLVCVVLLTGFFTTRPEPPDFASPTEWTLIKVGRVATSATEIAVYLFNREPSVWDSRDVLQNKIVAREGSTQHVYMWPSNNDYAAGWCELVASEPGAVAIVLFESDAAARVVHYSRGQFVFRLDKDELIVPHALRYEDVNSDGVKEFVDVGAHKAWRWNSTEGFQRVAVAF
jgi:hypothetical protein